MPNRKFLIVSKYGEILDLALWLQDVEHEDVTFCVTNDENKKIGLGLVKKSDTWMQFMGQGCVWVFDGCEDGKLQDWLRSKGEAVFGGSEKGDRLENDRQLGQRLFKRAGFKQPESKNFTDLGDALKFVEDNDDKRWILKQNGSAPKHLNHMGKFEGNIDLLYHLECLKKSWNEADYGKFDCDLMEVVEGTEVAASAFFNGEDWMRNEDGKVVGFINCENKKECDGDMGATTGEMGTVILGCDEDNTLFEDILLRPEIGEALKEAGFRGVFDINGCLLDDGDFVAFEATARIGVPIGAYILEDGLETNAADLMEAVARGEQVDVEVGRQVAVIMVMASRPFPIEANLEDDQTSTGERLWLLKNDGQPHDEMTAEQRRRIKLYNFFKDDDDSLKVATESGYMLTVSGYGDTVEEAREDAKEFAKENLYLPGMKWRQDLGYKIEDFMDEMV